MNQLEELQTILMLGTDRAPLSEALLAELQALGVNQDTPPEALAAAALVYYRQWLRAGFVVPKLTLTPEMVDESGLVEPECNYRAGRHLEEILEGKYPDVLGEWMQLLLAAKQGIPRIALPTLFDRCVNDPDLWAHIQPAIGYRGYWLLQQHPQWQTLWDAPARAESWSTVTGAERVRVLRRLRLQDPALGQTLLTSTWADEDPAQKPLLLAELSLGLSKADEPFLATCLQDKRKETRQLAAELLASLPESDLQQRYQSYAQTCLQLQEDRIQLDLPAELPEAWRNDGIEPGGKAPFTAMQRSAWLFQLLRRVNPVFWETHWGLAPLKLIALFAGHDREESWVQALCDAVVLYPHPHWQSALVQWWLQHPTSTSWQTNVGRHLLQSLPEPALQDLLTPYLQKQEYLLEEGHVATYLLCANPAFWNDELSLALIQPFKRYLAGAMNPFGSVWHYTRLLRALGSRCQPQLLPQLNSGWSQESVHWSRWQPEVERMLTVVQFRTKMHQAFQVVDG